MNLAEIEQLLRLKGSRVLIEKFTELLNKAFVDDVAYFDTGAIKNDARQLLRLVGHAEQLWLDSVSLLEAGSLGTSIALSIASIEETGKVSAVRFLLPINALRRRDGISTATPTRKSKSPFFSHNMKHQLAAFGGFAINTRADRVRSCQ